MSVKLITEEAHTENGESVVKKEEYEYPLVLETGRKYVGIRESGEYNMFEQGTVRNLINKTSCVVELENVNKNNMNRNNKSSAVSIKPDDLDKPIDNIIQSLMSEYSILHGNTNSFR